MRAAYLGGAVLIWMLSVLAGAQAAGSPPAMTVPGQFNVSPTGSATYSIPITTPPGTSGIAPSLSLGYSSQGGDGFEGIGWGLGGLSSINRCPRTLAQDGVHGSVNYDSNDRFCMNGQRLILISGTYGANGSEYRTEIESFSKIIAHGTAGSGPAWFEVHTKAGQIMQFGNTVDSQVLVVDAVSGVTSTVRTWAVNKVSDVVGNYYTVTYNCTVVSGACTDASRTTYGEVYPLEIDYTGNASAGVSPYNSVRFSYTGRSDSTPMYQAGGITQTTVLLSDIKTYQGSNVVFDYQLAYRMGNATQHSRLTSLTLCDGGNSQTGPAQKCLVPTSFGWQGGPGYLSMTGTANPLPVAQGSQLIPGDYNGDGLTDVMPIKAGACSPFDIYLGTNGMGIDPLVWTTWSTPADGASSCTISPLAPGLKGPNGIPYLLTQILATFPGPVTTNTLVMVNNQAGNVEIQNYSASGAPPTLPGDYNGDGLIDFFSQVNPTSYAYLGDGVGGFTPDGGHSGLNPANTEIVAADFDGDGCTDILALPTYTGGGNSVIYFCNPAVASVTPPSTVGYNIVLGDFNGDGKTDILLTSTSTTGKLYLSTGTGFTLTGCSVPSGWGNYTIQTGNWDGDGKADLLIIKPASGGTPGSSELWVSTGNCFTQAVDSGNNPITIATQTTTPNAVIADWNNDGASDIWMQEPYNSTTPPDDKLYTFQYAPELMTSVSNGIGSTTNIAYDRINRNGTFYAEGSSAVYPTIDINGAFYVVSRVDLSNGLGTCNPSSGPANCYSSIYAYAGGQTNLQGRGFLGFSQVTVTDLQTNIIQTTNYDLVFPFTGMITSQTKKYLHNTNNLSSVTNTLNDNSGCGVTPASGIYFTCITQNVTAGYDLNDIAAFPTTTTSYTYDSYGNALTIDVAVSDGSSKDTTNTYSNDTTNWFLGRLLTTSVNSIVGSSNLTRQSSFAYDASTGLLTQESIEPGVSTCNGGSDPCTITTAYTYDAFGHRVTSEVYGTGITTRMTYAGYDSLGQFQTYAMNALGQAETWLHDARFGEAIVHTGPNGVTTFWAFDTFGRLTQEKRPDGTQTVASYAYCSGSCPTSGTFYAQSEAFASNGVTQIGPLSTTYYDLLSRPIAADTQGFDGSNVRVATIYDTYGRISQTSRPYFTSSSTPKYSTFSYDALGRATQVLSPNASTVTNGYNGLTTTVTNSLGQTTTTTKNAQGLNASVQDAAGKTMSYVYDATGNLVATTDPAGNVITLSYDIRGNKHQSADPDMGTWNYVHDVQGELTSQTDAKSQTTTLTYDLLARPLTRSESGLYSAWTYGASVTDHNVGQVIDAKTCTSSGCSTLVSDRTFNFDAIGRPSTNVLQTGGNYYGYRTAYNPTNGQIGSVTYPSGFMEGHFYNNFGYLCALAEDGGYFGCNTGADHVIETVNTRDAEGHLTQSTAGNGVVTNQTFDPSTGLPSTVRAGASGAVASFDYTFDAIGNLNSRTDHNENYSEGFCYDNMNRLTSDALGVIGAYTWGGNNWGATFWGSSCGRATGADWGPESWGGFLWGGTTCNISVCKAVGYDTAGLGNITGKSDVGTYSYPSAGSARPHAVSSISGVVDGLTNPIFTYDSDGNMTCVSTGAGCTGTVSRQVTVTAFNMAASITEGGTSVAFTYDSEHQRVQQATTVSGTTTTTTYLNDPASGASALAVSTGSGAPTWTEYVKLDGNIVAQRTATNAVPAWGFTNWYASPYTPVPPLLAWGASIPASNWGGANNWYASPNTPVPPVLQWGSATGTSWAYFVLDHLGSVSVITDGTGAVTQRLSYDAWGKQRNANGTDATCGTITSSTTRGFTNQEQVPVACLVNLNARIYDPTLGKFMAPDPTIPDPFNGQAYNRYAYVLNNPLSFVDPTGLCTDWEANASAYGCPVNYDPADPATWDPDYKCFGSCTNAGSNGYGISDNPGSGGIGSTWQPDDKNTASNSEQNDKSSASSGEQSGIGAVTGSSGGNGGTGNGAAPGAVLSADTGSGTGSLNQSTPTSPTLAAEAKDIFSAQVANAGSISSTPPATAGSNNGLTQVAANGAITIDATGNNPYNNVTLGNKPADSVTFDKNGVMNIDATGLQGFPSDIIVDAAALFGAAPAVISDIGIVKTLRFIFELGNVANPETDVIPEIEAIRPPTPPAITEPIKPPVAPPFPTKPPG